MHTSIAVFAADLASPTLTGNSTVDRWQCELLSHFGPGPASALTAYLSAADARTISTAFATLADDIDAREAATAVTVDTDPTPAHGISRDLTCDHCGVPIGRCRCES
jgi:hypothetical protein